MKLATKTLLVLMTILIIPLVIATISYDLNAPVDHLKTTASSVFFNWTVNSTTDTVNPMPSYLFITNQSNESQFILNKTIRYCLNNSVTGLNSTNNSCSTTVSGFNFGYLQWKVVTGEAATSPLVTGTNSYPFDTSDRAGNITSTNDGTYDTRDRAGNVTSNNAENYNTSDRFGTLTSTEETSYNTSEGNRTIEFTYTNASTTEFCNITFDPVHSLPVANVTAAINNNCNLTASGTGNFTVTTKTAGANEFIYITTGNATVTFGLSNLTNYTGSVNNSIMITYTLNGLTEFCNTTLTKSNSLSALEATNNITRLCNLTGISTNVINLNTNNTSGSEWIYFNNSSALGILGFDVGVNYTGSSNNTLNIDYTLNGLTESCAVTLTKNSTLLTSEAVSNITQVCNLTATDVSFTNLNTNNTSGSEWLYFNNSSALSIIGFLPGVNYTGSSNNTIIMDYTVNGTVESCTVSLSKSLTLPAADVADNITQTNMDCNVTATNTTILILTGSGFGEEEYINITGGTALGIIGLNISVTYGTQINSSDSTERWIRVMDGTPTSNHSLFRWLNDSGFIAMTLGKDDGNVWFAGVLNVSEIFRDGIELLELFYEKSSTYNKSEIESFNNTLYRSIQIEAFNDTLYRINQIEAFNDSLYKTTQIESMNVSIRTNISAIEAGNNTVTAWQNISSGSFTSGCPSGSGSTSAVTTIGTSNTCTDAWVDDTGGNMTGSLSLGGNNLSSIMVLNFTVRAEAPTGVLGIVYVDSTKNELCFYNGTGFINIVNGSACQ